MSIWKKHADHSTSLNLFGPFMAPSVKYNWEPWPKKTLTLIKRNAFWEDLDIFSFLSSYSSYYISHKNEIWIRSSLKIVLGKHKQTPGDVNLAFRHALHTAYGFSIQNLKFLRKKSELPDLEAILRTTGPILGLFVLIWMYFTCWIQIW